MDLNSRKERRLQFYKRQLKKSPQMYTALCKVLDTIGLLSPDEELYLHVLAPAVTEFAEWILRQAEHDGKSRLYFLARDAWPVFLAAEAICTERGNGPECRYLSVSRYALRLPEYRLLKENCVDRICVGGIGVTLRKILKRSGLDETAILHTAEILGLTDQMDKVLLYPEIQDLKRPLRTCSFFLKKVRERSEESALATMMYLEQEGLLDGIPFAIVDSGWIGTQQDTLERLLHTGKNDLTVDGYYFGLYEIPPKANWRNYRSFYFSPLRGLNRKIQFSNCLFEAVCSAPEGMTVGYQKQGTRYVPIRGNINPNAERMNRYAYLVRRLARIYGRLTVDTTVLRRKPFCRSVLKALMSRPQKWEVEAFENLIFSDDMLEQTAQRVAVCLTERELREFHVLRHMSLILGLRKGKPQESAWIEGSIVLSDGRPKLIDAALYKMLLYIRKAGMTLCVRIKNWNGLNSIFL